MKNLYIHTIIWIVPIFMLLFGGCSSSGGSSIELPEGLFLRFSYTHNSTNTNLFTQQVKTLDLHVYNEKKDFVKTICISKGSLTKDNVYQIPDLLLGNYTIAVWGNIHSDYYDYDISPKLDNMKMKLVTNEKGDVKTSPDGMFHAVIQTKVNASKTEQFISLIKNTNNIQIIIEDESLVGNARQVNPYTVSISGSNGNYDYKNNIVGDKRVNYIPEYNISNNTFRADVTVMRLMKDDDMTLVIKDSQANILHNELLTARLMEDPKINNNDDLNRYDNYTLRYKAENKDGTHVLVLVGINDWDLTEGGGGI